MWTDLIQVLRRSQHNLLKDSAALAALTGLVVLALYLPYSV